VTDVASGVMELAKKSSISWIRVGTQTYPVWHEWIDDAIYVVGSVDGRGGEQPIPDVHDGEHVTVLLRTKGDGDLAAAVETRVEIIGHGSRRWDEVTPVLKAGRLNLPDLATAIDRWARECRVLRLVPTATTPAAELPDDIRKTLPRLS
jgi:hypothetical protein